MTNTISFVSIKGGVGKTTIAIETAVALSKYFGKKVLLVDGNFSAPNIGLYLDLTNEINLQHALNGTLLHNAIYESHGVDIVPAALEYKDPFDPYKLKKVLEKYKQRYDYIIIDSSPNFEELKPIIAASDRIFVVTTPDHVNLTTSLKAARLAREKNTPIEGIIVNRIRNPKHEYNISDIENISEIPVMAKIYENKKVAKSVKEKKPIVLTYPRLNISKEIKRFASAIAGTPEEGNFIEKILPINFFRKERVNRELLRQSFYESQL